MKTALPLPLCNGKEFDVFYKIAALVLTNPSGWFIITPSKGKGVRRFLLLQDAFAPFYTRRGPLRPEKAPRKKYFSDLKRSVGNEQVQQEGHHASGGG
ncbi:MAG TPA: hypothetical protein IAD42_02790 [Candidatus Scatomorpha pullistercoris]|uniref:Uncharacterized protein n=1 Tax=Candidatus Scatomorpha pullistercoris TaxID=2840929 RepID=A0A9D1K7I3_9FIRM|nr:hypothetical protein [Candidatus Scatomorpha pullistercoris]